jgi:hypothetical protein
VPDSCRPAQPADTVRLKSSEVIHRREFVTRDPWCSELATSVYAAMADARIGHYSRRKPAEYERSEISGGGAGRRLDGTPATPGVRLRRTSRAREIPPGPAKAGHYVLSPAEAGHYVRRTDAAMANSSARVV